MPAKSPYRHMDRVVTIREIVVPVLEAIVPKDQHGEVIFVDSETGDLMVQMDAYFHELRFWRNCIFLPAADVPTSVVLENRTDLPQAFNPATYMHIRHRRRTPRRAAAAAFFMAANNAADDQQQAPHDVNSRSLPDEK